MKRYLQGVLSILFFMAFVGGCGSDNTSSVTQTNDEMTDPVVVTPVPKNFVLWKEIVPNGIAHDTVVDNNNHVWSVGVVYDSDGMSLCRIEQRHKDNGKVLWKDISPDGAYCVATALAIDVVGNIYVVGTVPDNNQGTMGFIKKINTDTKKIPWIKYSDVYDFNAYTDRAKTITIAPDGLIYVGLSSSATTFRIELRDPENGEKKGSVTRNGSINHGIAVDETGVYTIATRAVGDNTVWDTTKDLSFDGWHKTNHAGAWYTPAQSIAVNKKMTYVVGLQTNGVSMIRLEMRDKKTGKLLKVNQTRSFAFAQKVVIGPDENVYIFGYGYEPSGPMFRIIQKLDPNGSKMLDEKLIESSTGTGFTYSGAVNNDSSAVYLVGLSGSSWSVSKISMQ